MRQIRPVLEGIYKDPSLRKRIVPIFMGNPGLGKTFIINEFVQFTNDNKVQFIDFFGTSNINPKSVQYIASQVSPFEVSGIGMPDKNTKEMIYYNYHKLTSLKDGDILFFDELPNANPNILNALLTLIEDRVMISGDKLPDIMIVAAGNYQGMTPMTPQIKRRFVWYNVEFNAGMWKDFMRKKYSMPSKVSNKLCDLIKNEEFTGYNFNTSADLDKATEMIIKNVPTPYEKIVKPILETLIENKDEDVLLSESENKIWKVGETIKWLELIRYGFNIKDEDEIKTDDFKNKKKRKIKWKN